MAESKKKKPVAKKKTSVAKKKTPAAAKKKPAVAAKKKPSAAKKKAVKKPAAKRTAATATKLRALVTGAAGFVGGHVVEELIGAGMHVIATDMPGADLSFAAQAGAVVAEADMTSRESLDALFAAHKPDYVAHLAALYDLGASRDDLMRINRDGSENMFRAAHAAGVKHLVFFSTGDVYGQPECMPITEDCPPDPINPYSESKLEAEKIALAMRAESGFPVTIIRPTVVYGPRSRYIAGVFFSIPGIVRSIGDRINLDLPELPVFSGGARVSWVHARDIAAAVRFLLGRAEAIGEIYNVADDRPMSLEELFTMMFRVFGYEWKGAVPYPKFIVSTSAKLMKFMPDEFFTIITRFMRTEWSRMREKHGLTSDFEPRFDRDFASFMLGDRVYDNTKIKSLGFRFPHPDSRDGFEETIDWYRSHNWLP